MNFLCFLGEKVMLFELAKNDMAALNNEDLAKIWNPGNAELQTAVYGL